MIKGISSKNGGKNIKGVNPLIPLIGLRGSVQYIDTLNNNLASIRFDTLNTPFLIPLTKKTEKNIKGISSKVYSDFFDDVGIKPVIFTVFVLPFSPAAGIGPMAAGFAALQPPPNYHLERC